MISPVVMIGIGAGVTAIGFGLARRARDAERRTDPWDAAGSLLKILGTFTILAALALCIPPPRNLMADPTVAPHTLSGLQLRPSAVISLGEGTGGLRDSPKP